MAQSIGVQILELVRLEQKHLAANSARAGDTHFFCPFLPEDLGLPYHKRVAPGFDAAEHLVSLAVLPPSGRQHKYALYTERYALLRP